MDLDIETLLGLPGDELQRALSDLFKKYGDKVGAWKDKSKHCNSLAHRLANIGDVGALECLVAFKCDVNVQRLDLNTPLHLAYRQGQPAVAERLISLGADLDIANGYGETPRKLGAEQERQYVFWHQQADLLVNIAPLVLRRLFRERWSSYAGPGVEIGSTILHGSADRRRLTSTARVRRGRTCIEVDDDLSADVKKGQRLWLAGFEVEAAEDAAWSPPRGRLLGCGDIRITAPWPAADAKGNLEAPRLQPVNLKSLGHDAYVKVRNGNVDSWDLTLLTYLCADDNCALSHHLVSDQAERKIIRELKDARNKAGLHLGRTEVDEKTVNSTSIQIQQLCDALVPALSVEVQSLIAEARGKTVITESMRLQLEQRIIEEQERAELMQEQLESAARFKKHIPPAAFASLQNASDLGIDVDADVKSEWSATRVSSVWKPPSCSRTCANLKEMSEWLAFPKLCQVSVIEQCLEIASSCPEDRSMMIVIRTAASLDHVMLEDVSKPEVQQRWKDRHCCVSDMVPPVPGLFEDWCLPDGVLISGDQGRVLRVSAQFRPVDSSWKMKGPTWRRAFNVACAVQCIVIASEMGTLLATTAAQAQQGEYVQLASGCTSDPDDFDTLSMCRSVDAANMEGSCSSGPSGAAKTVVDKFWPCMKGDQAEATTQALLPMATEQVRHWSDGSLEITAGSEDTVSWNTAKWLWQKYGQGCTAREAAEALACAGAVMKRLEDAGFEAVLARLLLPMGEITKALDKVPEAVELLSKARRLAQKHDDFENGFSAHQSLFAISIRSGELKKAEVMLLGAQQLLEKERIARDGAGMETFVHAKQLFLDANKARLDTKLAMTSRDPQHLKRAHELLESTVTSMAASEGGSFRGNTSGNLAELCNLWSQVAMARDKPDSARIALERELPVWRAQQNESKLAICLVNLGRVLLELDEVSQAQQYLCEAHIVLQGLMSAAVQFPRSEVWQAVVEMRQLSARCCERLANFEEALRHLRALAQLPGYNQEIAQEEIKRLKSRQKHLARATDVKKATAGHSVVDDEFSEKGRNDESVDDLVAFIDGESDHKTKRGTREKKKNKQKERLHTIEERLDADEDAVGNNVLPGGETGNEAIEDEEEGEDKGSEQNHCSAQCKTEQQKKKKKAGKRKK